MHSLAFSQFLHAKQLKRQNYLFQFYPSPPSSDKTIIYRFVVFRILDMFCRNDKSIKSIVSQRFYCNLYFVAYFLLKVKNFFGTFVVFGVIFSGKCKSQKQAFVVFFPPKQLCSETKKAPGSPKAIGNSAEPKRTFSCSTAGRMSF